MVMRREEQRQKRLFKQRAKWMSWTLEALKRDGDKCVDCGVSQDKAVLIVHHIDESRKKGFRNMNNELDNLATLCRPCHARRHGYTNDHEDAKEMRLSGYTFQEIGGKLGLSRQRVHQICKRLGVTTKANREEAVERRFQEAYKKFSSLRS